MKNIPSKEWRMNFPEIVCGEYPDKHTVICALTDTKSLLDQSDYENGKSICKAINNTYVKGINPESVELIYNALDKSINEICRLYNALIKNNLNGKKLWDEQKSVVDPLIEILNNAKIFNNEKECIKVK